MTGPGTIYGEVNFAMSDKTSKRYVLRVPLDASQIADRGDAAVKVVVRGQQSSHSQLVELGKTGKGIAELTFSSNPGSAQIYVGPVDATDDELAGLQTLTQHVSATRWAEAARIELPTLVIAPYYWYWWRRWCRVFRVTGRVLCADGRPVPGAKVCTYDIDWWWWWSSSQLLGCDTTDATGAFEIKFRWCCGWRPLWWWDRRFWQLDPRLVDRLKPVLEQVDGLTRLPRPSPRPQLDVFAALLGDRVSDPGLATVLSSGSQSPTRGTTTHARSFAGEQPAEIGRLVPAVASVDPSILPRLRDTLLARLPSSPELERLRLWPWYPWHPWWDCSPDLIFKVTQNCHGQERVIVDENFEDARVNIPTVHSEILRANQLACCVDDTPDPDGNCLNLTHVCDALVSSIGGNLGAEPAPVGYLHPGALSNAGDRPFSGNISLRGAFGNASGADYYEIEWWNGASAAWEPLPVGTLTGFSRLYYGPALPAGPVGTHTVAFPVQLIDGHYVIETRQHFEANNGAGTWDVWMPSGSRWWMNNKDALGTWLTANNFPNGTYRLRIKTWQRVGASLVNPRILGQCGTQPEQANGLVLTTDNRVETTGATDLRGHPCGSGTVHVCTDEPDTAFLAVRILHSDGSSTNVTACGQFKVVDSDQLQIDFVAHDPEGHLAYWTLVATYGDSLANDLLSPSLGATLSPSPFPLGWAPPAAQVGPGYVDARLDALPATSPNWHGGVIRLTMPARHAFPETCCYQLELRAHKRTVVNCDHSLWGHVNYSEYSFLIEV